MPYFDNHVKNGDYCQSKHFTNTEKTFFELKGKVFGIIGIGKYWQKSSADCFCLGAKVVYYSTSGVPHNKDYPSVTLDELLLKSDIISIHSPLNEKTKNLISLPQLKMMKTTA